MSASHKHFINLFPHPTFNKIYDTSSEYELFSHVTKHSESLDLNFNKHIDYITQLKNLIIDTDALYVANLATYIRENLNNCITSLILIVELAKIHTGTNLISNSIYNIIKHPIEMIKLLSYYQFTNNKKDSKKLNKLSNQLKKGLSKVFITFSEKHFAECISINNISLRDVLFLTHPKPHNLEMKETFKKIADNTLYTV